MKEEVNGGPRVRPPRHRGAQLAQAILVLFAIVLAVADARAADPELPPLAASPGSPRLPGKFIWGDLVTGNVEAARNFYGPLLGWEFRVIGEGLSSYTIAMNDKRPLAGLVNARVRAGAVGGPRWVGYISVADVARAAHAVVWAGGNQLVSTRLLPKRGEQAVFADPEGAVFGVMASAVGDPEDFLAEPGDWIWITLLSRDARKATGFYRAVAGYDVVENADSAARDDFMLVSGGFSRAAVIQMPANRARVRPAWLPFVRVSNLAAALSRVPRLGGNLLLAPRPDLFGGRLAVVVDAAGAAVGLVQWDASPREARRKRP